MQHERSIKVFYCTFPHCRKYGMKMEFLECMEHVAYNHAKETMDFFEYKCNNCPAAFVNKKFAVRHLRDLGHTATTVEANSLFRAAQILNICLAEYMHRKDLENEPTNYFHSTPRTPPRTPSDQMNICYTPSGSRTPERGQSPPVFAGYTSSDHCRSPCHVLPRSVHNSRTDDNHPPSPEIEARNPIMEPWMQQSHLHQQLPINVRSPGAPVYTNSYQPRSPVFYTPISPPVLNCTPVTVVQSSPGKNSSSILNSVVDFAKNNKSRHQSKSDSKGLFIPRQSRRPDHDPMNTKRLGEQYKFSGVTHLNTLKDTGEAASSGGKTICHVADDRLAKILEKIRERKSHMQINNFRKNVLSLAENVEPEKRKNEDVSIKEEKQDSEVSMEESMRVARATTPDRYRSTFNKELGRTRPICEASFDDPSKKFKPLRGRTPTRSPSRAKTPLRSRTPIARSPARSTTSTSTSLSKPINSTPATNSRMDRLPERDKAGAYANQGIFKPSSTGRPVILPLQQLSKTMECTGRQIISKPLVPPAQPQKKTKVFRSGTPSTPSSSYRYSRNRRRNDSSSSERYRRRRRSPSYSDSRRSSSRRSRSTSRSSSRPRFRSRCPRSTSSSSRSRSRSSSRSRSYRRMRRRSPKRRRSLTPEKR